jgi:hypothetical protein
LTWKGAPIALVDGVPSLPMSFRCGTHGMVTRFLLCCVFVEYVHLMISPDFNVATIPYLQ